MVKLTIHELKLIAKNRSIKNYQNMPREKLLSTLDKSEHITENLFKNRLERIAGMQNLSLNELEQIKEMNNLSKNKLEQIAKNERIENYKNMSKEVLTLINCSFKSNKSNTELGRSEGNNTKIVEIKKFFSKLRNNFSKKKTKKKKKKIRTKFII